MLGSVDWLVTDIFGQSICPKTLVANNKSMLHNIPEEWISHLHHNRSLKSRIVRGDAGIPAVCWTASGILSEGCFDSCTSLWMISGISRSPLSSRPFMRCGLYWRNEWGSETVGLWAQPRIVFCWMRGHCHDLQDKFCCSCSYPSSASWHSLWVLTFP
jgi:hypothetical protein